MRWKHTAVIALALFLVGSLAYALKPVSAIGFLLSAQAASPCASGTDCVYASSVDNSLHFVNTSNTDTALGSGGGGGGSSLDGWSLIDATNADTSNVSLATGGSFTTGATLKFTKACTVTGIRFYWAGGAGAKTIKVSLWDPTNTRVATSTVAVNAAGIYSATFTSVSVSSSNVMKTYTVAAWDNSGNGYTRINGSGWKLVPGRSDIGTTMSTLASPHVMFSEMRLTGAGDTQPTSAGATELYPVEPVYTVP